jgi:baseplate wedge subunit and tail pin
MGFGTWVRFGEGRTIVSWNASDSNDADFGINNNANNVHAPGGTGGTRSNKLLPSQIPALNTDNLVLEKATNGDVIVGQCQEDPDTNGPGYKKYNEVRANVGA